jgi:hypothetical protein
MIFNKYGVLVDNIKFKEESLNKLIDNNNTLINIKNEILKEFLSEQSKVIEKLEELVKLKSTKSDNLSNKVLTIVGNYMLLLFINYMMSKLLPPISNKSNNNTSSADESAP